MFLSEDDDTELWRQALNARISDLDFRVYPEIGDPADIDVALVWLPPKGLLRSLPNLKAVLSLAAGVDAMLRDETLPDLPLCRMIDTTLSTAMSEYLLYCCIRYLRKFHLFESQQRAQRWELHLPPYPSEMTIGILGLGTLGQDAAIRLRQHGFEVQGWSRSRKELPGVISFAGQDELAPMLKTSDVVVCLLPFTAETEGVLNAELFRTMKKGSFLIHAGRGGQLVPEDLLAALQTGHLEGATIDVTPVEPLPSDDPLWRHPNLTITPHAAAYSKPDSGADHVAENIRRLRDGRELLAVVDREKGY